MEDERRNGCTMIILDTDGEVKSTVRVGQRCGIGGVDWDNDVG